MTGYDQRKHEFALRIAENVVRKPPENMPDDKLLAYIDEYLSVYLAASETYHSRLTLKQSEILQRFNQQSKTEQ